LAYERWKICVGEGFIPSFFIIDFWGLGGQLMAKEVVFDVGRKIHYVPWKYKKVFLFLFCFVLP
jgi:hypothetical protein